MNRLATALGTRPRLSAGALLLPILVVAVAGWIQRWVSDDGWINMRVIMQLQAGNGPVFNIGERVELGTSTLWLYLVWLFDTVAPFGSPQKWSIGLGILLMVAGMAFATLAALRLHDMVRRGGRGAGDPELSTPRGVVVPFGALVFAVLPPVWDFTTSGLETSLTMAWIGASAWLVVRRFDRDPDTVLEVWQPWPVALVIGLGPLVRPDITVLAATFAIVVLIDSRFSVRSWLVGAAVGLGPFLAYEIFRMGYYAALVPNTALAKGASESRWGSGLKYLWDYVGTYALYVPLLIGGTVAVLWLLRRVAPMHDWRTWAMLLVPLAGAVIHVVYVVRVGGDFMHARFLLPATFALLVPMFAIQIPERTLRVTFAVATGAMVAWSVTCGLALRYPYVDFPSPWGIADERGFYTSRVADTTTPKGWKGYETYEIGTRMKAMQEAGEYRYVVQQDGAPYLEMPGTMDRVVLAHHSMGMPSVAAGPEVFLADRYALADPITARTVMPEGFEARAGHAYRDEAWRQARYAQPQADDSQAVKDARTVIQCEPIVELQAAVSEPLTWDRFWRNVTLAPKLTSLRYSHDPATAITEMC
ncbi:hypothetical protein [Parenemella sanctibonifatiensis]|uniref:Terminal beta-(1->2)-arabinofuranosyltransferase C-terminal domain-containing protein n=1 Tax=Parenemella sanctibonifatiensis TaxID=2016505 RepID=A0A255E9S1_9ACTN|nr:hypothetical protein [Parenemella sanctibonifatiensis]OYN88318.1 hypothetical protein CGZ92_05140 [Parenemella sanctibonifatiensis]